MNFSSRDGMASLTLDLLASFAAPPQRKKRFAGHTIAGYACEPHFSPDGRFLSSGDGQGNMVFWDFKTGRIHGRLNRAHKQVIISHAWLPREQVRPHSSPDVLRSSAHTN